MSAAPMAAAAAANPWAALGGAFLQGFGSSMNSPAGPSNAVSRADSIFDSSGWNVNFGSGAVTSADSRDQGQMGQLDGYVPYILAAAAVMIVWRMTRR